MQTTPAESKPQHQAVRRQLGDGDADAIAHLHFRVYLPEFGRNQAFVNAVAANIRKAVAAGWPAAGGAVWLIDGERQLSGALGLTHEGGGVGQVRWFVLDRSLRGQGWGGALLGELIDSRPGRWPSSLGARDLQRPAGGRAPLSPRRLSASMGARAPRLGSSGHLPGILGSSSAERRIRGIGSIGGGLPPPAPQPIDAPQCRHPAAPPARR